MPPGARQRGAVGKWVFKKAMEPYLPREIIYRPKAAFGVPLRQWLRGPLRHLVDEGLSADSVRRRGVFNPDAVKNLIERDRAGRIDATYTIFSLLCIELWCRMFVDGDFGKLAPAGLK